MQQVMASRVKKEIVDKLYPHEEWQSSAGDRSVANNKIMQVLL